jgi:hypothetical protein
MGFGEGDVGYKQQISKNEKAEKGLHRVLPG